MQSSKVSKLREEFSGAPEVAETEEEAEDER